MQGNKFSVTWISGTKMKIDKHQQRARLKKHMKIHLLQATISPPQDQI